MFDLREHIPTQFRGHTVARRLACADALATRMTKPVIVPTAKCMAEDAL